MEKEDTFTLNCVREFLLEEGFDVSDVHRGALNVPLLSVRLGDHHSVRMAEGIKDASLVLIFSNTHGEEISRHSAHIDLYDPSSLQRLSEILKEWRKNSLDDYGDLNNGQPDPVDHS